MTSEQKVRTVHPNAQALYNQGYKYWGIFLDGTPRIVGITPGGNANWSDPFVTGITRSNAWVNARKKMEAL